jgi:predicted nucleotide-binding protein
MNKKNAISKLHRQLAQIRSVKAIAPLGATFWKWQRDTQVLLSNIYTEDKSPVLDFREIISNLKYRIETSPKNLHDNEYVKGLERAESLLESCIQEISDYWPEGDNLESETDKQDQLGKAVFLVHGHDEAVLHQTARLLEKFDLAVVILRELPNAGRTIIEKFVDYSDVRFAVVLLTGDDRGGEKSLDFDRQKLRPRQNVILELGYFLGKLGRNHVCALYQKDVEIPSDYDGVLFVQLDQGGAWRFELARELKAAGIDIDMNKVL